MRNTIWNKRIPSLLGIFLLLFGVGVTAYLMRFQTFFSGRAAAGNNPQNLTISNISGSSFTVSYTTTDSVAGTIAYGKDSSLGKIAYDDRDQTSGQSNAYTVHYMTIKSLEPNTKYAFTIISGSDTFQQVNQPYTAQTGPVLKNDPSSQPPLAGTILKINGEKAKQIILYLTGENTQTLSTLTKDDGTYLLPLNAIRQADFKRYAQLMGTTLLKLKFQSSTEASNVLVLANQINPVPAVVLSKDYDFTSNPTPSVLPTPSVSLSPPQFPAFQTDTNTTSVPAILTPKKEESFKDQQPVFSGTAPPGQSITIEIHSQLVINETIKSDAAGKWSFRPKQPLTPGNHTIKIMTRDAAGILRTITQSFVVYAQGSQSINPSVSPIQPSPSPSPSLTPTLSPIPSPTVSPTAAPTIALPTPTIPAAISQVPVPSQTTILTPPPKLEKTGSSVAIISAIFGTIAIGIGVVLFFLTFSV